MATRRKKPVVVRCALCLWYVPAVDGMMCDKHRHAACDHDGCTWGEEASGDTHAARLIPNTSTL